MRINGVWYRTIWLENNCLRIIDQRALPHQLVIMDLPNVDAVCDAISHMAVRGAGLIGATAGYGMALAAREAAALSATAFTKAMHAAANKLVATRPTASNLALAVARQMNVLSGAASPAEKVALAYRMAQTIADEDAEFCKQIGQHGVSLLQRLHHYKKDVVHVLTHCNAGWLAFVDYGSALSPIYAAHDAGIPIHVWVDETRPRNQGASLTAFELAAHGVPHTLIADNAGGHLMQHGMVDMVITGADRVTRSGDAANKIGTYLKALAAHDNNVPFYVALPSSTFDFAMDNGLAEIPIEQRGGDEVRSISGALPDGSVTSVLLCPEATPACNWAFDVTPARLITGLITERGICVPTQHSIAELYPDRVFMPVDEPIDMPTSQAPQPQPEDGVIKFVADHDTMALDADALDALLLLDALRTRMHDAGFIGVSADGIGFGNVSMRLNDQHFLITGSATGGARVLGKTGYAVVTCSVPHENRVVSHGSVAPSSETMTHAAIYAANPRVRCVIHGHHGERFARRLTTPDTPRTPEHVAYGTPRMAESVRALTQTLPDTGLFITPGHQDGLFAFADTIHAAENAMRQA